MGNPAHLLWLLPAVLLIADALLSAFGPILAPTVRRRHLIYLVVALAVCVIAGFTGLWVFAVVIVLNVLLGRSEFVPFSTYSMFAFAPKRLRAVVITHPGTLERNLSPPFPVPPPDITKVFRSMLDQQSEDRAEQEAPQAKVRAAQAMTEEFERRRLRASRPKAPIDYDIVELWYELRDGQVCVDSSVLVEVRTEVEAR